MPCRAAARQCELSSYTLYGEALVVLHFFPTLTLFRCFIWRSHSNCGLISLLTQLHCLFLLPLLYNLQPLSSQPSKSEILYTEAVGWAGFPTLGHQVVKLCLEWLQEEVKLREVKVWHTAVFPMLPLDCQRTGGRYLWLHCFLCHVHILSCPDYCFLKDLMRWAKLRKPQGLQTIVYFGADL